MALTNLATPGVYIQEISTLPPSVAAVSTAVPAFIGYTQKGAANVPVRITSLLEFEGTFGGSYNELYEVNITSTGGVAINNATVISQYTLYYHLQMYFGNGGGPCHIISVGTYDSTSPVIDAADFLIVGNPNVGVNVAEQVDEVTLLVAPEVVELSDSSDIRAIHDAMLAQCDKLKDRFCIFDVQDTGNPSSDAALFRNSQVSANFLKYGGAYYPALDTILSRSYSTDSVLINDQRSSPVYNTPPNNKLSTIQGGLGGFQHLEVVNSANAGDTIAITVGTNPAVTLTAGTDFVLNTGIVASIVAAINNHPTLSLVARAEIAAAPAEFYIVARTGGVVVTYIVTYVGTPSNFLSFVASNPGSVNSQDTAIYTAVKNLLSNEVLSLNPSATMAGIYSTVDNSRGVWKAPANVSVANIIGPSFQITEAQQGGLNIDATSGKSINAIRSFVGRGTLVWGSRTLDGNSNEWRYVPVRRLFIFVEESCKKASEFVVFEPNDMNTWLRVKGTISNFLSDLWKQGALAGAKPEDAFFVRVGLGETMTAQDILEGKMIVSIGMAAVRPAEFIVLQFMHKLQEA